MDGLLFFPVQCLPIIVVGSVVVSLAFGTGVYYGFDSTQFVRAFGAGWCVVLVLHSFLLLFSDIEIEPPPTEALLYTLNQDVASADLPSSPIAFITVRTTVISIETTLMTVSIIFALFKHIPPF